MPPDTLASAGTHASQSAGQGASLPITGERTVPGVAYENYWFRRHEAAYLALSPYAAGAVVLEAGCGEGYGAGLLARTAARVVAVDYDAPTTAHAAAAYPHLDVVRAELQRLPVAAGSVTVIANLQVLEHLHDQSGFLDECARVLAPGGVLLMTTPNRLTFSPGLDRPVNPFHTRELSGLELSDLLAPRFEIARLLGVHHAQALRGWEATHGSITDAQLAGPPQAWSAALRERVAAVCVDDFEIVEDRVDASLDLVAIVVRRS